MYASGGNGAGGGDCANTSNLQGYVNGAFIGMNASNNPSYGKTAFIIICRCNQWERHITKHEQDGKGASVYAISDVSPLAAL
ncbi:hypothetical protein [Escherichia coli]|uniref:hypothetical protein n=1 Tax=Escherichia coli TaxID=562 RepID=UPI003974FD6E